MVSAAPIFKYLYDVWSGTMLEWQFSLDGGNGGAETLSQDVQTSSTINDEKKLQIVYITQSGEKYHEPDCRYVKYNNTVEELTLGEAVEKGYTACKVCNP